MGAISLPTRFHGKALVVVRELAQGQFFQADPLA
jgi:late competence protein required for DNA uptake (superfamily II DNA/RNA helicase)